MQECKNAQPLTTIFNTASAKILDFLLLNRDFDYSEADISRLAQTPVRTLQRALPMLLEEKLVRTTRKSGRSTMYMANIDSKRGEILLSYVKISLEENIRSVDKRPKKLEKPLQN